jgi:predicted MPP superfamily phosphohydrolase
MRHLTWVTDIHLNFLKMEEIHTFCEKIAAENSDALLISGDIAESHNLIDYLNVLESKLKIPIYFVLGNHDFYQGSISGTREAVKEVSLNSPKLKWLPSAGVVSLTSETCLIGHDGWSDGRSGDFFNSEVWLNDYILIDELKSFDKKDLFGRLNKLGDETAAYLGNILPIALSEFNEVILLTHVPPFKESCWHDGKISDDNWLPHFSCQAVGEVLFEIMKENSGKMLTVLCGHTHGAGEAKILPNLLVKTGGAEYKKPEMQRPIFVN